VGPPGGAVLRVAAAPSDAQRAYLSGPSSGVLRSLDGGVTWQPASAGMTNLDVRSLAVSPVDAGIVLAGTNGGAFRTTDGASHWVAVSGTLPADEDGTLVAGTRSGSVYRRGAAPPPPAEREDVVRVPNHALAREIPGRP
jgi:hypothetical protein